MLTDCIQFNMAPPTFFRTNNHVINTPKFRDSFLNWRSSFRILRFRTVLLLNFVVRTCLYSLNSSKCKISSLMLVTLNYACIGQLNWLASWKPHEVSSSTPGISWHTVLAGVDVGFHSVDLPSCTSFFFSLAVEGEFLIQLITPDFFLPLLLLSFITHTHTRARTYIYIDKMFLMYIGHLLRFVFIVI